MLYGHNDENLKLLRNRLGVQVVARGDELRLQGEEPRVAEAERAFRSLLASIRRGEEVEPITLEQSLRQDEASAGLGPEGEDIINRLPRRARPKTAGQRRYVGAIARSEITFGIGPAGTGKTYLAVAMAAQALKDKKVKRILLTRPAVEAGEKLGFLPGDLQAKIDPYLRPLYDALYDMMEPERVDQYLEHATIEVAPLGFMRGRAQPLFSRVLTPLGWREMGSLEVGDYVIGSNGQPTQVLGIYPQGHKEIFRISMTDGSSTLCCAEHLWTVLTPKDRRRGRARVLETREMMERLRRAHQHRFEVPLLSEPVTFAPREVPLDPYALGLLLGDGCLTGTTTPTFATADPELASVLEAKLEHIALVAKSGVDYVLRHTQGGRGGTRTPNPVTVALRELGLCGSYSATKFVPERYLYNAAPVRLAVLQGLLDTDGGPVTQQGRSCRVQYVTTSPRLCEDVMFLVRSLGGVAYRRQRLAEGRKPGRARGRDIHYRSDACVLDIRLPAPVEPFRLARKAEKYATFGGGRPVRFIESIEPAGASETRCIRVAARDSLYLTDDFILTHNTLNDAFIILDEAQNTTPEQMKMFLTRMGFNSRVVVTGDMTQTDLPGNVRSGLSVAESILRDIEGIDFVYFGEADVVRHPLVARIVKAYERSGS
jgi:phosphate starvation-inducible PhoH-like protein